MPLNREKNRWARWVVVVTLGVAAAVLCGRGWAQRADRYERTHSRSQYVHRITLYDAAGQPIDPDAPNPPPYSPQNTCAKCHDYDAISHGYHFNAPDPDAEDGRRGEPWIWTDDRTGTQIPVTYRDWPGTFKPGELGLSEWEFVLLFGRHMPGGWGEEATEVAGEEEAEAEGGVGAGDEDARWGLAGPLAIDCMICHSGDQSSYRHEVWADQIELQNFAWAPTAALGLAEIEGAVSRPPAGSEPAEAAEGEDGDGGGPSLPTVEYDERRFDSENKVLFDIVGSPSNNACYACHTTRPVGGDVEPRWTHDQDVHLLAGMSCMDCHRNGIEHHTVRGYEGEEHPTGLGVETLSCRGCHMGSDGEGMDMDMALLGGRLGSPKPRHEGIPPLHFERMACTACHSGPVPGEEAGPVQTSLAHGLGLPSQEWADDQPPAIAAPVFLENENGKIAPHRMVWPAYWGRLKDGEITPIDPDEAFRAIGRAMRIRGDFQEALSDVRLSNAERIEALGEDRAGADDLSEEERAKLDRAIEVKAAAEFREKLVPALEALEEDGAGTPVYLAAGKAYRIGEDGETAVAFDPPEARPYYWPLAHDVRPAGQSLGVRGCAECHADESPFYYGTVTAAGPAPDDAPAVTAMHELRELDATLLDAWAGSFQGRSAFKVVGTIALVILLAVLLLYGLLALAGLLRVGAQRGRAEEEG